MADDRTLAGQRVLCPHCGIEMQMPSIQSTKPSREPSTIMHPDFIVAQLGNHTSTTQLRTRGKRRHRTKLAALAMIPACIAAAVIVTAWRNDSDRLPKADREKLASTKGLPVKPKRTPSNVRYPKKRSPYSTPASAEEPAVAEVPGRQNVDDELRGHDPAVAAMMKVTSTHYLQAGFKQFEFGSSLDEVRTIEPFDGNADLQWIGKENLGFFFDKGVLRGIWKVYEGDNAAYIAALVDTFGKAAKEDVIPYTASRGQTVHDEIVSQYRFPKTHLYVHVRKTNAVLEPEEVVDMVLFDRSWLLELLDRDMQEKRRLLKFARQIIEGADPNQFRWDVLPAFPNTRYEHGTTVNSLRWAAFHGKDAGPWDADIRLFTDSVFEIQQDDSSALFIRLFTYSSPDYTPHPLFQFADWGPSERHSALEQDVLRCNAFLVREMLPVKPGTLQTRVQCDAVFNFSTNYLWSAINGWNVAVFSADVFSFSKPRTKRL